MIRTIRLADDIEVLQLLSLQMTSYLIEARLIGFRDIPPLNDSMLTLRGSGETFFGYFHQDGETEELVGAVSYSRERDDVTICRMMVHPDFFRQGIASSLLQHVQAAQRDVSRFLVSTGTANGPAVALYTRNGFVPVREREIAPGVTLTDYVKRNTPETEG